MGDGRAISAVGLGLAFLVGSVILAFSIHHGAGPASASCHSTGASIPRSCGSRQENPLTTRIEIIAGGVVGFAMLVAWARQRLRRPGAV